MNQADRFYDDSGFENHLSGIDAGIKQSVSTRLDALALDTPEGIQAARDMLTREINFNFGNAENVAGREIRAILALLKNKGIESHEAVDSNNEIGRVLELASLDGVQKSEDTLSMVRNVLEGEADLETETSIRQNFSDSLNVETEKLVQAWNIKVDEGLVQSILSESDPEQKSRLIMEYAKSIYVQMSSRVDSFGSNPTWCASPRLMKENGIFSCRGATIIGQYLLNKAGIDSFPGEPFNHVVNIIRLPNNQWAYADFTAARGEPKIIDANVLQTGSTKVLKVNDEILEFEYIPLHEKSHLPRLVLENMISLIDEAENENAEVDESRRIAIEIAETIGLSGRRDLKSLKDKLYGVDIHSRQDLDPIKEGLQREKEKIRALHDALAATTTSEGYLDELSPEQRITVLREIRVNFSYLEKYLHDGDLSIFSPPLTQSTQDFLQRVYSGIQKYPDYKDYIIKKFIVIAKLKLGI